MDKIVCLCGSTRFKEAFEYANKVETLKGDIVLSVGYFGHVDGELSQNEKMRLDCLHLRKIKMADEILVIDVGGYIGDSTRSEIEYAKELGKPVRYISNEARYHEIAE